MHDAETGEGGARDDRTPRVLHASHASHASHAEESQPVTIRDSLISIAPMAPGEVLVASADPGLRRAVLGHVAELGMHGVQAESGEHALEVAVERAETLDCILLGLTLSDVHGWEVLRRLLAEKETAHIPVMLVVPSRPSDAEIIHLLEAGAAYHVSLPLNGPLLQAKLRSICARAHASRELRHKLRYALENAAHDPLTGLFNRRYFERRLREEVAHARRHRRPFSIVMLDLDHFKLVNDTYGHEDGDRVLCHVADVIRGLLREDDVACRHGGEEFVILLRTTGGLAARTVANRLRTALAQRPLAIGSGELRHVTFSAGVAAADDRNAYEAEDILSRADVALYRAKRLGRNRVEAE